MGIARFLKRLTVLAGLLFFMQAGLHAQGDGPRAYLLAPKGITGLSSKYMLLDQNIIPAGTGFVPGADIGANMFPLAIFHTFSLKGRFAQALVLAVPGNASAKAVDPPAAFPYPNASLDASGFADGMLAFKLGLFGAPALNAVEFAKAPMQFSLFGEARYWYSGSYDPKKLFNLGTNRGTFQIMAPMAIPLNRNRGRATWLEVAPSLQFFGKNDEPSRNPIPGAAQTDEVTQKALFILENHLSHNFGPKFWGVANLRYQQGGQTFADGVGDENTMSILGAGVGIGYQVLPFLSMYADYGGIVFGDNGAESQMLRISATLIYLDKKKLQAQTKAVQ